MLRPGRLFSLLFLLPLVVVVLCVKFYIDQSYGQLDQLNTKLDLLRARWARST